MKLCPFWTKNRRYLSVAVEYHRSAHRFRFPEVFWAFWIFFVIFSENVWASSGQKRVFGILPQNRKIKNNSRSVQNHSDLTSFLESTQNLESLGTLYDVLAKIITSCRSKCGIFWISNFRKNDQNSLWAAVTQWQQLFWCWNLISGYNLLWRFHFWWYFSKKCSSDFSKKLPSTSNWKNTFLWITRDCDEVGHFWH